MDELILLRRALDGAGGAERVFKKYLAALEGLRLQIIPVAEAPGTRGASWWRALRYTAKADEVLKAHPQALSISLERGPAAMIYRAGDGVHKRWRELTGGWSPNPLHWVNPMLDEKSLRSAKRVIANSQMIAREIGRYYPWATEKVRVIYNGFDPKKFAVSAESIAGIRTRLLLPENLPLFLFAGSGWKRKGLAQAIAIVKELRRGKFPTAQLVVVGKGKKSELRALKGEPVIYRGVVDKMADYYNAADALILPTLYDPFANVTLEAMACGLPVVTTATNGGHEIIRNGTTGYIMPEQSSEIKEAAAWLQAKLPIDRAYIAESVASYTVEREVGGIRELLKEISNP